MRKERIFFHSTARAEKMRIRNEFNYEKSDLEKYYSILERIFPTNDYVDGVTFIEKISPNELIIGMGFKSYDVEGGRASSIVECYKFKISENLSILVSETLMDIYTGGENNKSIQDFFERTPSIPKNRVVPFNKYHSFLSSIITRGNHLLHNTNSIKLETILYALRYVPNFVLLNRSILVKNRLTLTSDYEFNTIISIAPLSTDDMEEIKGKTIIGEPESVDEAELETYCRLLLTNPQIHYQLIKIINRYTQNEEIFNWPPKKVLNITEQIAEKVLWQIENNKSPDLMAIENMVFDYFSAEGIELPKPSQHKPVKEQNIGDDRDEISIEDTKQETDETEEKTLEIMNEFESIDIKRLMNLMVPSNKSQIYINLNIPEESALLENFLNKIRNTGRE